MKRYLVFLFVVLLVCGYAYFGVYQKGVEQAELSNKNSYIIKNKIINKIELFTQTDKLNLMFEDNLWWMTSPYKYLANQERLGEIIFSMTDTPYYETFPFQEDSFGFSPGKATLHLVFEDLESLRLVIGTAQGPTNSLYLLNPDLKRVYLVHNVWGQLLHSTLADFLHPYLPIPGKQVKAVRLRNDGSVVWSVEPGEANQVRIQVKGSWHQVNKAKMLWFFKQLKEFKLKNHQWNIKTRPKGFDEQLEVELEKGNIIFSLDKKNKKIWIPRFSIIAEYNDYALGVLTSELEKAVENGKK